MAARPKKHRDMGCEYYYNPTECFDLGACGR